MAADPEALQAFRAAHGRLCTLYAQAIQQGHERTTVAAASRGEGQHAGPTLNGLKRQRIRVNGAFVAAQDAGVPLRDLIAAGRDVKRVVEKEWDLQILLQEK